VKEKNNEILKKIFNFIRECRKEKSDVTDDMLYGGGAVYYMNANNGTEFDWEANERTCKFCVFYKATESDFIKVYLTKEGTAVGYIYDSDDFFEEKANRKKLKNIATRKEAYAFSNWLFENFDAKGLLNTIVKSE
jgi:hypothetical protein